MPQPPDTTSSTPPKNQDLDLERFIPLLRIAAVGLAAVGMVSVLARAPADERVTTEDAVDRVERSPLTTPSPPAAATAVVPAGGGESTPGESANAESGLHTVAGLPDTALPETPPDEAPTPPPTTAPPSTTTAPPPTTAPPTTVPPTTAPPTTAPPPQPSADPGTGDARERAQRAFETAVPERWRIVAPAQIHVILGSTSWSTESGRIYVGYNQLDDSWDHALYVLAHEWGHQAAYRFGTGAYLGAPPAGFPGDGSNNQAELWSECVAQALLGFRWDNPYPHCPGASLAWTADWLASGPPSSGPSTSQSAPLRLLFDGWG